MDDNIFRVVVALLLIAFVAHRGYYTRKVQHAAGTVREQPDLGALGRIASLLALPAFLSTLAYIVNPQWMAWSALPLPAGVRWLGVAAALGGFALLQWAQETLGPNWSDAPRLVDGQAMVARGPYRWIRHPIYAGFLLILGALLPLTANWFIGGAWIALTVLDTAARMRVEEAMLARQFGDSYSAYLRTTGRLWPRFGEAMRNEK